MVKLDSRLIYSVSYQEALFKYNILDIAEVLHLVKSNAILGNNLCYYLAFLYPRHPWRDKFIPGIDYRGDKSFQKVALPTNRKTCEIHRAWGYHCNNPIQSNEIQFDHIWPYSLGGETHVDNLIALCPFHNSVKSNDYHWFPFEVYQVVPNWVIGQVNAIIKQLELI